VINSKYRVLAHSPILYIYIYTSQISNWYTPDCVSLARQ